MEAAPANPAASSQTHVTGAWHWRDVRRCGVQVGVRGMDLAGRGQKGGDDIRTQQRGH